MKSKVIVSLADSNYFELLNEPSALATSSSSSDSTSGSSGSDSGG